MVELKLALQSGCEPSKIMFDSPYQTSAEILEALRCGVCLKANSLHGVKSVECPGSDLRWKDCSQDQSIGWQRNNCRAEHSR
jgi:hypothetical protein